MTNSFFPRIGQIGGQVADVTGRISNIPSDMGMSPMSSLKVEGTEESSFKNVMTGLAQNLNQQISAPDQLLKDAMSGNSDVDIHDVMTAMAKAEISVNVATQLTTKVIQAYDKIMQISV